MMTKKKKDNAKWYLWLSVQQIGVFVFFVFFLYFLLSFIDSYQAQSSLTQVRNYIQIYNEQYMDDQIKNIQTNSIVYKVEQNNIKTFKDQPYIYHIYKDDEIIYGEDIFEGNIPEQETVSYDYKNDNILIRQHIISEEYDIYVVDTIDLENLKNLQKQLDIDIILKQSDNSIISTTDNYNKNIFEKINNTNKDYIKLNYNGITYTYIWENFYNEKEDFIAIGVLQQTSNLHLLIIFSFIQFICIFIMYIFQIFMKRKSEANIRTFNKKVKIKTNFNLFV